MADLSRVESFLAFWVGIAASETLGLRGAGRFVGGFTDVVEEDGVEDGVSRIVSDPDTMGSVLSESGARHRGHCFASGESTETSTTSLVMVYS
jgi:hypothetical protein